MDIFIKNAIKNLNGNLTNGNGNSKITVAIKVPITSFIAVKL